MKRVFKKGYMNGDIFSSLYLTRNVSPYGRGLFPCMSEREREVRRKEKKKKKIAQKNHFAVTGI